MYVIRQFQVTGCRTEAQKVVRLYLLINVADVDGAFDLISHTPLRGLPLASVLDDILARICR